MTRGARLVVVLALFGATLFGATGCAVDTELGIDATIVSTVIRVATGDVVNVEVTVDYRLGTYAEEARSFQPQAIDLLVDGESIATLTPVAPADFVRALEPGDSFRATFTGGESGTTDPRRMCGAEVTVLFRWLDPDRFEIGMTESSTIDVTCD